ncbi:Uncharacterised protein [Escherichia coli]|uniref:Uncharacterized protein n=1 Tax=Escherichia coli TaxID=562 RepID=A0A447XXX0_ECOLX|nr:Uncharacterised protein [Escherichia coli]
MGAKILIAKPQYRDNATGEGDYSIFRKQGEYSKNSCQIAFRPEKCIVKYLF